MCPFVSGSGNPGLFRSSRQLEEERRGDERRKRLVVPCKEGGGGGGGETHGLERETKKPIFALFLVSACHASQLKGASLYARASEDES